MAAHATGPRESGDRHDFEAGLCTDLGAFDRNAPGYGLDRFLADAEDLPDWITIMEDRQPDFFNGYRAYEPGAYVPLNRHGPHRHRWTQKDMQGFVQAAHERGIRVLLGAWIHEGHFLDERHPELQLVGSDGETWMDPVEMSADFNPMKRMRADPEAGIQEGERYADFVVRQYQKLQEAFDFDGFFVGDGGMGFRYFMHDDRGCAHYDYDPAWIAEFRESPQCEAHTGCKLAHPGASIPEVARDVHDHHWPGWIQWTCSMWAAFHGTLAHAVHRTGGKLAAYNVMNFDPVAAYLHGADYRAIAEAGLDYLVFQTYDYAWGPTGPFQPARKDLEANLRALLRTKAHLRDTDTKVIFTTETGDFVEKWKPPLAHTLGEIYAYGHARVHDGKNAWVPAVDGTLLVWANGLPGSTWRALHRAYHQITQPHAVEPAPEHTLIWDDELMKRVHEHPPRSAVRIHHEMDDSLAGPFTACAHADDPWVEAAARGKSPAARSRSPRTRARS